MPDGGRWLYRILFVLMNRVASGEALPVKTNCWCCWCNMIGQYCKLSIELILKSEVYPCQSTFPPRRLVMVES
jgi:hypothetical protein